MAQSPSQPIEYTTHDFTVLAQHVDEALTRTAQIRSIRRANVFRKYCTFAGVFLVAAAFAGLLSAWAYWIAFGIPRPDTRIVEIEKPVVVKETVVVQAPSPAPSALPASAVDLQKLRDQIAEMARHGTSNAPVASTERVVHDFTLFTTVEFNVGGIAAVVTGARFESSKTTSPQFQYCYVEAPLGSRTGAGAGSKTVTIANKVGAAAVNTLLVDRDMADAVGTTMAVLKSAQARCRFL